MTGRSDSPPAASPSEQECRELFGRSAVHVAPELLGSLVSSSGVTIRLTEVEAYAGLDDPASHAFRGSTPRTAVMFGPPGHVYVYFVYGVHWAMNLVCQPDGTAGAVLLRAGEVIRGEAETRERRGPTAKRNQLARGPGNLAACLGVTGEVSGSSLSDGPVTWSPAVAPAEHEVGPRVGVSAAADTPWRMWVPGEPTVSAYRAHKPRRRRS